MEASPSRHRSRSRHHVDHHEDFLQPPRLRGVSRGPTRRRAVSVNDHGPRHSAPVQYIEERESEGARAGSSLVLVRPRNSDHDVSDYIRDLEEETRLLRLERQGGIEITQQRDTEIIDSMGNEEEVTEVRRQERRGMAPPIPMFLSLILTICRTQLSPHACYDGNFDLSCFSIAALLLKQKLTMS